MCGSGAPLAAKHRVVEPGRSAQRRDVHLEVWRPGTANDHPPEPGDAARGDGALVNAAYAWLKDTANEDAAIALLPARLKIERAVAVKAYRQIASQPMPEITADGLKQVISIVWASEKLAGTPGEPQKYLDLSYLNKVRNPR